MGSIPDPGDEFDEISPAPSFEEFQRQASLMTSCTLLWKELSDHFSSLEQNLQKKSESLMLKIKTLDSQTKQSLQFLDRRDFTVDSSLSLALSKLHDISSAALSAASDVPDGGEVDDAEGLKSNLRFYCMKMDSEGLWRFVTLRKKELESIRAQMGLALADCVDPAMFVLEAISAVFPVDKREEKSERANDFGWACVLMLESLVPVVIDPILGDSRLMVTPKVKERAKEMAETWKKSLEERGGIENVKSPDVHTFLQHLVTFGIFNKEDLDLYRKLVVGSAWRKQMPKLAVSLGLSDQMPDMIEELISRGQQVDAVHFTFEVGLEDKFPPVPLLKAFLKDAKKAADSILGDPNNSGRAAHLAARKEQSALRAVIKCIEEYKLAAEFPPENLRKRVEQLEKVKNEKKRPAAVPANKRTRANNGGPMPPAKAGRSTNAYVSSFPAAPAYVRSPSHTQYPTGVPSYPVGPTMYGNRSPPVNHYAYSPEAAPPANHYAYSPEAAPPANHYAYSPEAAALPLAGSYPVAPMNYPHYGGYGNGVAPAYQQAYYR